MAYQQGMNQMTPAQQLTIMGGRTGGTKRRKSKSKRSTKRMTKRASSKKKRGKRSGKLARLVKGSRAAKLYMAKIRKRRK